MMTPTIHMNGTSPQALMAELEVAHGALAAAHDALRQVTVHGRDYYPQGPNAYAQARHEMDARLEAIARVQQDVLALHAAIQEQGR